MKKTSILFLVIFFGVTLFCTSSFCTEKHKILYIGSYHQGYGWSADIAKDIKSVLNVRQDVEVKCSNGKAFEL